jgi:dTDP-4-amino-4,6-dideoxygalactose transaminase
MTPDIPQTNPKANYLAHREEIEHAIARVLEGGFYILGGEVAEFEREFAAYVGVSHGIGTGSGTDALQLALRACGIGPGDTVITVAHTAVATVAAIELAGATPVLIDVDPRTFTLDPNRLGDALKVERSASPKAVIPVHLYGHPADMPAIMDIATRAGLRVIEDCAQSQGAAISGRKTGSWGDMAAFSFYPTKNLGALGDAGALLSNDPGLAGRARQLREYGWRERHISEIPGLNTRLDELQAAILRVKLQYLDAENEQRRRLANLYENLLNRTPLLLPEAGDEVFHVYHQYVVRSQQRDALRVHLRAHGIGTQIHYPVPIHLQPAYRHRIRSLGMERTEEIARQILSLPMYPELTENDIQAISDCVARWAPAGG